MWRPSGDSPEEFENALRNAKFTNNAGDDWVRIAGIKISIDGGMTLRSAYVRDPYAGEPDNYGTLSVDPDVYKENVTLANQYGWRVGTHAVGDAAIDIVLDAYENASNQSSIRGERFTVIHGSLIAPDQVERAARLDVRVDAQNVFMWDKAETVESYMGLARAIRSVPTKLLVETLGLENTAAGTDNEVNILNPFIGLYIMVTRKDPAGKIYGADQAVTREQALRLYTSSGPYYTFEEDIKGTIEPGKLADMVVLSADYLTVPEESIKDITPLQTIVGGKVVYEEAPAQ
jgi:predicted amidohydrolase YtcJ